MPIPISSKASKSESAKAAMLAAASNNDMEIDSNQTTYGMPKKTSEIFENQDDGDDRYVRFLNVQFNCINGIRHKLNFCFCSETASVTSNLTQMYVSDEEDRIFGRQRFPAMTYKV